MREKQKARLVVKLQYDYGDGYERQVAGGRIMDIEGVTPEEIDAVETIFSALDWVEMETLEKALGVLLNNTGLMRLGRHEGRKTK